MDWLKYGLHIEFPKGSLPSGRTVELQVQAVVAGDFKLPPECCLVSGIYWINCSERFEKEVTLHLPHAAIVKSVEEASRFRIYAAKCSSGAPYQFKELAGSSVTPFSKSASIKLHQFSYFCLGAIYNLLWSPRQRYYSKVYYKQKQLHEWDIHVVVMKDEPSFRKVICSLCRTVQICIFCFCYILNSSLK